VIDGSAAALDDDLMGGSSLKAGVIGAVIGAILAFFLVSKKNRKKA
jgi:hypothetical protein